jgi:site-specific DNA-cytosine methylase
MRLLELFSGTKSVSKAIGTLFNEVVSIDILQKFNPTIITDILTWDYKQYPVGHFDTIWASPPCTEYSIILNAHPNRPRNLDLADSIVKRTLEIIDYFKPNFWYIENPQTGLLKNRDFMLGIPFYDVDYCMYSNFGYKKRTRIWTNIDFNPLICNKNCGNMEGNRHKKSCGNSSYQVASQNQRYSIPIDLIRSLRIPE